MEQKKAKRARTAVVIPGPFTQIQASFPGRYLGIGVLQPFMSVSDDPQSQAKIHFR